MIEGFATLAGPASHEIERIHGSRFLATAAPVGSEAEIAELLRATRKVHHAARHHCFAWRLGADGQRQRANDDGEPGGSAGRPILERIDALGLSDVVVIVTRYFGGVKLGVGGLARAYGRAAAEVLARAPIRRVVLTRRCRIEHAYELAPAVQACLASLDLVPSRTDYGERVRHELEVPLGQLEVFHAELRERTAGRVRASEEPPGD